MDNSTKGRVGWSDTEKLEFILQLVAKLGKIPWDEIELPAGRTQKACSVMLDREKGKIRKARGDGAVKTNADDDEEGTEQASSPVKKSSAKKRKAASEDTADDKKVKKPRAKKSTAIIKAEEQDDDEGA